MIYILLTLALKNSHWRHKNGSLRLPGCLHNRDENRCTIDFCMFSCAGFPQIWCLILNQVEHVFTIKNRQNWSYCVLETFAMARGCLEHLSCPGYSNILRGSFPPKKTIPVTNHLGISPRGCWLLGLPSDATSKYIYIYIEVPCGETRNFWPTKSFNPILPRRSGKHHELFWLTSL